MRIVCHKFQEKALTSPKKIIVNASGIQGGKTTTGSLFIIKNSVQIPRDWNQIIVAPTYKILAQATLPKFLSTVRGMGTYRKVDATFKFRHGPTAFIRSLSDPNAIEGITDVGGIWADEAGLFSRYAWENVMGRAAFKKAPIMVTTTPYALNWLYHLWKDWKAGLEPDVEFISYSSIDNPYFPREEFEAQRRRLDPVRFAMKYLGQFGRMEGLVYPDVKFINARPLPQGTRYYGGIDWGFTNPFAMVVRAVTPEGLHYRVDEIFKAGLTTDEQIDLCKVKAHIYNIRLFVADPSNPGAITAFNKAGLKCIGGKNDVVEGIDRHRTLMKENRFFIFKDENPNGFDEYETYHYPEKTDLKIDEDEKEQVPVSQNDHSCDADRYVTMHLTESETPKKQPTRPHSNKIPEDALKRIEWLKRGGSSRYKEAI